MKYFIKNNAWLGRIIPVALLVFSLAYFASGAKAADASMSFAPSTGSITVGNNLVVAVHENSGSTAINGVALTIKYPTDKLKFVKADSENPFIVAPADSDSNGTVKITRGSFSGVTGDQVVTNITFSTIGSGTATVAIDTANSYMANASDGSHVPYSALNGSYTLNAQSTGGGGGTGGGGSTGGGGGTGGGGSTGGGGGSNPAPAPAPHTGSKSGSVKVTTGSTTPVTVPDGGSFQIDQPVDMQPATTQSDGVDKIEYYINGELADTETEAPYVYHIDTQGLGDGKYKITEKTYYANGQVKDTSYDLIVSNANAGKLFNAILKWIIIAVIVLIIVGIIYHRRGSGYMKGGGYVATPYDAGPTVTSQNNVYSDAGIAVTPSPNSVVAPVNGAANAPADFADEESPGMVFQPLNPTQNPNTVPTQSAVTGLPTQEVPPQANPLPGPTVEPQAPQAPQPQNPQTPGAVFHP